MPLIDRIRNLEERGVLCPPEPSEPSEPSEPNYWRWNVTPHLLDLLPPDLKEQYDLLEEIRWYGTDEIYLPF